MPTSSLFPLQVRRGRRFLTDAQGRPFLVIGDTAWSLIVQLTPEEIDRYLDALAEPKRATLARLRQTILDIIPEAEQGISYGVPAFKVGGKTIAGFAALRII